MFISTCQKGEAIVIGDRIITFVVLAVRGSGVTIGVKADEAFEINREPIFEAKSASGYRFREIIALPTS
jgi:carbon storage regulator CsrA